MTKKEIKNWKNNVKTMSNEEKQIVYYFFKAYYTFEMLDNIQDIFDIYNKMEYDCVIQDCNFAIKKYAELKGITEYVAKQYLWGFVNGTFKIKSVN